MFFNALFINFMRIIYIVSYIRKIYKTSSARQPSPFHCQYRSYSNFEYIYRRRHHDRPLHLYLPQYFIYCSKCIPVESLPWMMGAFYVCVYVLFLLCSQPQQKIYVYLSLMTEFILCVFWDTLSLMVNNSTPQPVSISIVMVWRENTLYIYTVVIWFNKWFLYLLLNEAILFILSILLYSYIFISYVYYIAG